MSWETLGGRLSLLVAPLLVTVATVAPSPAGATTPRSVRPTGHVLLQERMSPLASPVPSQWLAAFNYYRDLATPNLPDVVENVGVPNDNYTYWDQWHATYMVETQSGINHQEDPANTPWYHPKGHEAAQNSNLAWTGDPKATAVWAIEGWMTAPFHGLQMLDPRLLETGFGLKRKSGVTYQTAAGVDVSHDDDNPVAGGTYPIVFPGTSAPVYLDRYGQSEVPNPFGRGPCTHYNGDSQVPSTYTGPPIYLIQGPGTEIHYEQAGSSFMRGTTALDFCAFDGDLYDGGPFINGFGNAMEELNTVFLFPLKPLKTETEYTVTINTTGIDKTWSFDTGDLLAPKSRVKSPAHRPTGPAVDQDNLEKIKGTASGGDVTRVDVAIGGLLRNGMCKFRKGDGTFTGQRFCSSEQQWLRARGKADWAYSIPGKLPPTFHPTQGQIYDFVNYLIYSRARDEVDNIESKFAAGRNKNTVHVTP